MLKTPWIVNHTRFGLFRTNGDLWANQALTSHYGVAKGRNLHSTKACLEVLTDPNVVFAPGEVAKALWCHIFRGAGSQLRTLGLIGASLRARTANTPAQTVADARKASSRVSARGFCGAMSSRKG